jgi:hypothetical protein
MKNLTKILFVSLMVFFVASCKHGGEPQLDESTSLLVAYCTNEIQSFVGSAQGQNTFSAAIQLPDTMLLNRGKKIVAIRVGIDVPVGTSAEVFISEDLEGTPLVVQQFVTKGNGWDYVKLNTPFTIPTNKELYIGYNVKASGFVIGYNTGKTKDTKTDWIAMNGSWTHLSSSIVSKGRSLVQAFVTGNDYKDYPQYDIELSDVQYEEYLGLGSENIIRGIVTNYGVSRIATGIKVTYSDGTITQSVIVEQPFMNGENAKFVLPSIAPSAEKDVNFTVTAEPVNAINNGNSNTFEGNQVFYGTFLERTLLFEEFTTAVCVNCPLGATVIHNAMDGNEEKIAFIAQHVGYYEDTYTIAASRNLQWFYNDGGSTYAPAFMVDRRVMPDIEANTPVILPQNSTVNVAAVNKWLQIPAFVSVNLSTTYNPTTRELAVTVSGEFLQNYPNARLNVWLTQDNIVGYQSVGGNDYVHNNVARAVLSSSAWGDAIPNTAGTTYSKSYTYTIPDNIMGIATSGGQTNQNIPCVPENMKVVAFVADVVGTPPSSSSVTNNIKKFEVRNAAFKKIIE